jgi:hypothetical protein
MLKLQQDQVWKVGDVYLRILRLERLAVTYKSQPSLHLRDGRHYQVTKKEFCRLIKGGILLPPDSLRAESPPEIEAVSPPPISAGSREGGPGK